MFTVVIGHDEKRLTAYCNKLREGGRMVRGIDARRFKGEKEQHVTAFVIMSTGDKIEDARIADLIEETHPDAAIRVVDDKTESEAEAKAKADADEALAKLKADAKAKRKAEREAAKNAPPETDGEPQ